MWLECRFFPSFHVDISVRNFVCMRVRVCCSILCRRLYSVRVCVLKSFYSLSSAGLGEEVMELHTGEQTSFFGWKGRKMSR